MTFKRWLIEAWDDLLVYALTLLGVIMAQFLPLLKASDDFDLTVSGPRALVAAVVALWLVLQDEDDKGGDPLAKKGKKANLRRRFASALTGGFSWSTLTGMV
jgi:hypothetical protein